MQVHHLSLGDDRAEISTHGGQLLRWRCDGSERLFLSPRARQIPGQAIRGGIPVIFPQFAERGRFGRHGFARLREWKLQSASRTQLSLCLGEDAHTLALWPHAFNLQLDIALQPHALQLTLCVENRGPSAFEFSAALHTYLGLAPHSVRIEGLAAADYEEHGVLHPAEAANPLLPKPPLDRIYSGGSDHLRLGHGAQTLRIEREGFTEWVLWNPGADAAEAIDDLGGEAAAGFLCVEPGLILRPRTLAPGANWRGSLRIAVLGPA